MDVLPKSLNLVFQSLLAGAIFIVSAIIYIPFAASLPDNINLLDGGWIFAMQQAVAQHLVFGKDIIFTFGPYASLFTSEYQPETAHIMFAGSFLMAVTFAFSLICLSKKPSEKIVALILALLLAVSAQDTKFIGLSFVALAFICRTMDNRNFSIFEKTTFLLVILALGMFPLIKATFGICAVIVLFITIILLINRRKFIAAFCTGILFVLWMSLLWVIVGQPLADLAHFFVAQLPIISGYSAAMSISGPLWQVLFFIAACSLIWFFGNGKLHKKNEYQLAFSVGSAFILFLAFKEGFVRDDLHRLIAAGMLSVAGGTFLLAYRTKSSLIACVIGLVGFLTLNFNHLNLYVFRSNAVVLSAFLENPNIYKLEYDASLKTIRSSHPLPKVSGTTDIYSWGQAVLLAAGLKWDPRPIFQSYSAYTPALEDKNKRHLIGPNAPQNIFFTLQAIDLRLPALEDGASWPLLLADYQFKGMYNDGNTALLERRVSPIPTKTSPIMSGFFKPNTLVKLSQDAPLEWAQIIIRPTLLGRIAGAVFKPPSLQIRYVFPDGHEQEFRYIAGMGESGFLISPLVESTNDFVQLTAPNSASYFFNRRPSYISIETGEYGKLFWNSKFFLKVYQIQSNNSAPS